MRDEDDEEEEEEDDDELSDRSSEDTGALCEHEQSSKERYCIVSEGRFVSAVETVSGVREMNTPPPNVSFAEHFEKRIFVSAVFPPTSETVPFPIRSTKSAPPNEFSPVTLHPMKDVR